VVQQQNRIKAGSWKSREVKGVGMDESIQFHVGISGFLLRQFQVAAG